MSETLQTPAVLVHDYLLVLRGAERTFAALADLWPEAPVATLLYDQKAVGARFASHAVRTSPLQKLGADQSTFRRLLPVLPAAASRLPVQDADLVVSSSSAFAHGVRPAAGATHVCYCHSPFRYAWHERTRAVQEVPGAVRPLLDATLNGIRRWDCRAAHRDTHYVANSALTRDRIGEFWGREASIVHPPVEVDRFRAAPEPEDFFLVVGEVVAHKRVELTLEAARRAGRKVKVVGTGPELERLRERYLGAEFLGRVSDAELDDLYGRALALVVSNVEEFGIAAVEAQAAGRPVLAADAGGVRETVVAGETGVLVEPGDIDELAEAMRETDWVGFDAQRVRRNARRFSPSAFEARMLAEVELAQAG